MSEVLVTQRAMMLLQDSGGVAERGRSTEAVGGQKPSFTDRRPQRLSEAAKSRLRHELLACSRVLLQK